MENKKKQLILAGVGLAFLLVLVIGATYAYFQFTSQNDFKDPATIEGSMGELGTGVILTKAEDSTLTLNLSAADMLVENAQTYYASGSSTPKTIATIHVDGAGRYNCTYTLEVTKTATSTETDMYERFQSEGYTNKTTGQIWFTINGTRYDFNTANLFDENGKFTYTRTLEFISNAEDIELTANMVIVNVSDVYTYGDQTYLNGTDISLSINATEFNCELINENAKAEITSIEQLSVGADGVQVQVNATDVYGIDKYYYSVNGSDYIESENNSYTFTGLEENTPQIVSVYALNLVGNESDVKTETYNTRSLLSDSCSGSTLSECLLNNGSLSLQKTIFEGDDLYRYVGNQANTGVNNYICLGVDTCESGTDDMYRIIGVNPTTNEIKVIKETRLSFTDDAGTITNTFQWHNNTTDGVTWEQSDLYTTLNTTWLESISFADLIVAKTWNIGDVPYTIGITKSTIIPLETATQSTNTAKVGAMSATDYAMAYTEEYSWGSTSGARNYKNNWIQRVNNNWSKSAAEWTMTRNSPSGARQLASSGPMNAASMTGPKAVRPTFFLTPELQYVSGEGTVVSPFKVQAVTE